MPAPAPTGSISVSDMLDAAYRRFKSGALKCLPLMMPAVLAGQVAEYYWVLTGHRTASAIEARDGTYITLYLAGICLYLLFSSAAMLHLIAIGAGHPQGAIAQLQAALRRWPTVVLTFVLAAVVAAVFMVPALVMLRLSPAGQIGVAMAATGAVLLLLPVLYLMVGFALLMPVVLIEQATPAVAVRRSLALVRPRWIKVFAALLIATLAAAICFVTVWGVLRMILGIAASAGGPVANAIAATAMLLAGSLVQLFMLSLALEIYSSAKASA